MLSEHRHVDCPTNGITRKVQDSCRLNVYHAIFLFWLMSLSIPLWNLLYIVCLMSLFYSSWSNFLLHGMRLNTTGSTLDKLPFFNWFHIVRLHQYFPSQLDRFEGLKTLPTLFLYLLPCLSAGDWSYINWKVFLFTDSNPHSLIYLFLCFSPLLNTF